MRPPQRRTATRKPPRPGLSATFWLHSTREYRHCRLSGRSAALAELLDLVRDGLLSRNAAKQVFRRHAVNGPPPREHRQSAKGCWQVSDDSALIGWIDTVWREHAAEAQRYDAGEQKLLGVLVGLVMKQSKGRADPKRVRQLLAARGGGGG